MKRFVSVFILLAMCLGLCSCRMKTPEPVIREKEYVADDYIRTNDAVSLEMLSADYWTLKAKDEKIMSLSEISSFNNANNKLIYKGNGENISLAEIGKTFDGSAVKEILNSMEIPEYASEAYINGTRADEKYWDRLYLNTDADNIPDKVKVKFGFATVRSTLRLFPTNDYANDEPDDRFYDGLVMSDFMPFTPLAVLHESADGEWYFVAMYGYCGWIEKINTAICENKEDWLKRQQPEDFLVVTGKELRLCDDPCSPRLSGQILPMGTRLPLVKADEAPEVIKQRSTYGNYVVSLPVRNSNGKIADEYFLIPCNSDVSLGYLEYTHKSVVIQAFKLLGDIYGWAGSFNSDDCSGIIRNIYLCFGFDFPRTGDLQIKVKGLKTTDVSKMSDGEKFKILSNTPAGSLLSFSGHIMIYLGMDDGEPYVLSSVGSIGVPGSTKEEYTPVNSVIVSGLGRTYRKTGMTWLSSITTVLCVEPEKKK